MIPGSNLLDLALSVISPQQVEYQQFLGRALNENGIEVATYATPITISGSLQPVPRRLYEQYGLNIDKTYYTLYTSGVIQDVTRNVSGDQMIYGGKTFTAESQNEWTPIDGWTGVFWVQTA